MADPNRTSVYVQAAAASPFNLQESNEEDEVLRRLRGLGLPNYTREDVRNAIAFIGGHPDVALQHILGTNEATAPSTLDPSELAPIRPNWFCSDATNSNSVDTNAPANAAPTCTPKKTEDTPIVTPPDVGKAKQRHIAGESPSAAAAAASASGGDGTEPCTDLCAVEQLREDMKTEGGWKGYLYSDKESGKALQIKDRELPSDFFTRSCMPYVPCEQAQAIMYRAQVARAPGMSLSLAEMMSLALIELNPYWYQPRGCTYSGGDPEHNSKTYLRMALPLLCNNTVISRPDVRKAAPSRLPICTNSGEQLLVLSQLINRIMAFLELLGLDSQDKDLVTMFALRYLPGSGMGGHSDAPTQLSDKLFFMRLTLEFGGPREVEFTVHEVHKEEKREKDTPVPGLGFTIESTPPAGGYLMSPLGNGKMPFAWKDAEMNVCFVGRHAVKKLGVGSDPTTSIVIDFPIRTLEKVMKALEIVRSAPLNF